jgi:hypothetical protein
LGRRREILAPPAFCSTAEFIHTKNYSVDGQTVAFPGVEGFG